jgi:ADP-heptose:LPS heptosyltransferase
MTSTPPRRVLLGVGGHLGDAVLATSALRALGEYVPGVELGVVSGGWNRVVLGAHPRVRWFHEANHWRVNRSTTSIVKRWSEGQRSERVAVEAIRAVGYDAAIDLTPYYPNFARVFHRAGIATRVGYTSGGRGPLYTHRVTWRAGRHVSQDHLELLRIVFPAIADDVSLLCELAPKPPMAATRADALLGEQGATRGSYVVIHPGAGVARKEWPAERWLAVAKALRDAGNGVVFTGVGARQARLTSQLARGTPGAMDLGDRLSFDEFRSVIGGARLLLSVDTVAMHIAAAENVPTVALMTAIDDPARWRPMGARTRQLWENVPCAPCFRSAGCSHMACVRGVAVSAVLDAAESLKG